MRDKIYCARGHSPPAQSSKLFHGYVLEGETLSLTEGEGERGGGNDRSIICNARRTDDDEKSERIKAILCRIRPALTIISFNFGTAITPENYFTVTYSK